MTMRMAKGIGCLVLAIALAACGGEGTAPLEHRAAAPGAAGEHAHAEIAYYTCSMHPSVRSEVPGGCPICGMKLVPVTREEVKSGIITIDAQRRQTIGVTTETVARRPLTRRIRAVGRVAYDQTRLADVTLKLRGWVGEVKADTPGMRVRRGDILFTLYSPELFAAEEELLSAVASQRAALGGGAPDRANYLVDSARRRLRLWDIPEEQIERVLRSGKALEYVPIAASVSGYVIEKNVLPGAAVEAGMLLYRIADLDRVWLEADLYDLDLALVKVGDAARIATPYAADSALAGHVAFLYPYLDDVPRTGRVRIDLDNRDAALKPDMYADVIIEKALGERLAVPDDAVLFAGERSYVFVDLGEGRLKPQGVQVGVRGDGWIEILGGVTAGDSVVTSGNFLVAAESRLKVDMEHWR
jgi:Cu(I)/Ag(I) efflux system membrane fusion protein